jgi:hypothetical protein
MMRGGITILAASLLFTASTTSAQQEDAPLKIFGYFQNSLQHWTTLGDLQEHNSFSLQQLNLFFQKELGDNWTAFVNFEALNTFSSSRSWGALNIEESWVRYRLDMRFNLKLGLLVPTFNNLNEIKNRTPLLPYIIRPLVYETSFNEFIGIEDFVPARAFAQAYGFFPLGNFKLDYAIYTGNSPNINASPTRGQTGIDTTTTFSVGGRLGIRHWDLKFGLSATHDRSSKFQEIAPHVGRPATDLQELPRLRLGGDLSYDWGRFSLESEFIRVFIDDDLPELEVDANFYYATLGYHLSDKLFAYGTYWAIDLRIAALAPDEGVIEKENILTPGFGASYQLGDNIRLKAQYARVKDEDNLRFLTENRVEKERDNFSVYTVAISAFF